MFWVRSDLDSGNNFNFLGGGVFWNQIPKQGCSGEFGQKFLEAKLAGASQIVSHILCTWRLMKMLFLIWFSYHSIQRKQIP